MRMRSSLKVSNVSVLTSLNPISSKLKLAPSQQSFHTQRKAPLCLYEDHWCSDAEEDAIATQREDKLGERRKWRASRHFQSKSIDQNNFLLISKRLKVSPASVCSKVNAAGGKSLSSPSLIKTLRLWFADTSATRYSRVGYWWPRVTS